MPEELDGAGAPIDGNDAVQQGAGAQAANASTDQQTPAPPSANKLIKDFADARGVTVAKLLDQFSEMENAGKTELQRIEGERDQFKGKFESLTNRYRTAVAKSAVSEAAGKVNAIDPAAVFAIVRDDLEFDDETGDPTNVDAVLKDVQKRHPALFRAANGSADGGKGGPVSKANDVNEMFRSLAESAR